MEAILDLPVIFYPAVANAYFEGEHLMTFKSGPN